MSIPTPADWGQRLRQHRQRVGLTQEELAELVGVNQTTISQAEIGNRRPEMETQAAIAQALGVPISELFPRSEEEASLAERAARCTEGH